MKSAAVVLLLLAIAVWLFVRARPQPPPRMTPAQSAAPSMAPPPSPAAAPAEPPPAVPPADSRTEELLRANASLEPDPDLLARYRAIDARYFGRALPAASLRWEPRLAEVGPTIAENFRLEGATDGHLIILNPDVRANPQELQRALCHEMVHVAVWTQDRGHGPVFQRFLRDLADQGAFEGVVASDEEKLALRSALDGRAAALRSEAEALRAARGEVDAAPGSLRTDRAVAYNRRVEEYNASVADFNQLAARYNLMIVYPDGLDRERVDRRPVFADTGGR